jgi:precorrin-6Y C5,15-methyltransferase (decarboxylating)
MTGWLSVVGIGADGLTGLAPAARAAVEAAEVLVGGARHLAMVPGGAAERIAWPTPWDALEREIAARRGRRVVVLVTGDPLWFSAGEKIVAAFPEARVHPHVSAFQMAAARMGWPLQDAECLSLHGRPVAAVLAHLAPGARLLCLAEAGTAGRLAALLAARGWGESRLVAHWHMGGAGEGRREARARDWARDWGAAETPALTTVALEAAAGAGARIWPRWGLPDEAYESDGTMTKRELRCVTLARLGPAPGAMLWDVGCGSGSVAIEWMRAARDARAVGVEPRADRRAMAAANALALGAPGLTLVAGEAPGVLEGLADPDAVFLGGGLSEAALAVAWGRLGPGGRIVANAVTVESQALLAAIHARLGGELVRIAVSRAEPLGGRRGWRPLMEVMQWAAVKEGYLGQERGPG